ncbi:hypothetical protein [Anabaena azotica]|uniref:hypothetical protein n=1 Tax=Anabaena azotica TaxID=197653 RepID=UPI0039A4BFDD
MNTLNDYLRTNKPFSDAGVQSEAVTILTDILLDKGYEKAINHTLVNLCQTMINEHETVDIQHFCEMRETSAIDGTNLFLDLLNFHIYSEKPANFIILRRFLYAFAKAGNYFDTLLDWQEDYDHGIAPQPSLSHKAYVTKLLGVNLFHCANSFPINLEGIKAIAQIIISAFDFSN